MRPYVRLVFMLMLMMFANLCLAQEKVTLVYKAQANQVIRYKSEGELHMDAGGMKVTLQMKQVERITVTDVAANGNITRESELESMEITVNGEKSPTPDEKNRHSFTVRPDGSLVAFKDFSNQPDPAKSQMRLFAATNPVFPPKPVGIGEKWNLETKADADLGIRAGQADYEVLGFEKVGGADTIKVKMLYKETRETPPLSVQGTFWIEKSTGDAVVAEFEIENFSFGEGPMSVPVSGKIRQERISGAPLGGGKPAADVKPEPKKEKTIDDTVKEYEKIPGLFPLYRKREAGRDSLYMEVSEAQLNKLMMMEATASTGTANQVVAGNPIADILFKFVKSGDEKLLMVTPNISFRAAPDSPVARAVRRSFADGYLESFRIEATQPERKSLLINVSDLFRGDIAQISQLFSGGFLGGGSSYTMDREKTYIASLKNFPENLVVETAYHFSGSARSGIMALLSSSTLADPRSVPFNVLYTVFALPDNGYRPRLADPRVGYFQTEYQSFNDDSRVDPMVRYIYRWDVEKADPKLSLSPPKKPIVFWLDNAIPVAYRDAVREGLLFWNKAFEKIGIKDAIQVKQMPDNADWDHADMRYNTIRWVASPDSGYAVALFRINPITGQILNANITVDANLVHYEKITRKTLVEPASYFDPPTPPVSFDPRLCTMAAEAREQAWFGQLALNLLSPPGTPVDEKAYAHSFLRMVVSHEMGHIMGLRHNFIASTYHSLDELKDENIIRETGISASVMDYIPWNISALKRSGVDFFQPTIGPYDLWAIRYGYLPIDSKTPEGELYALHGIASQCNEPGHLYQSDEIADQFDPAVVRFDLGRDPLAYWTRSLEVSRHLLLHLGERVPKRGESYWEFTRDFNMLLGMYARAGAIAGRYVGGLHVNRNFHGDPGEKPTLVPIDPAQQKQALQLLNTYIFAENAFTFPSSYYTNLTADPNQDLLSAILGINPQDMPIRDQMSNIQKAALRNLFSPAVLKRMVNNEFKVGDPDKAFTLPTLYHSVGATVWSELPARRNIGSLRRELQRAYLDTMIAMVVSPPASLPDDARMLAWDQLVQLKSKIAEARSSRHDDYTRVHLDESLMRINRALDARVMIGTRAAQAPNPLQLLLGGSSDTPRH
jgi:hypothetical protein